MKIYLYLLNTYAMQRSPFKKSWRKENYELKCASYKCNSLISNDVFVQRVEEKKNIKHELDMQENQLPIKVYASSANLLVICSSSNKLISHVRNFISYVISSIFFSRFQWVYSFFAHKNSSESKRIRMEVPVVVIECSNYNLMSWSSYQLLSEFRAQLNVIVSLANK